MEKKPTSHKCDYCDRLDNWKTYRTPLRKDDPNTPPPPSTYSGGGMTVDGNAARNIGAAFGKSADDKGGVLEHGTQQINGVHYKFVVKKQPHYATGAQGVSITISNGKEDFASHYHRDAAGKLNEHSLTKKAMVPPNTYNQLKTLGKTLAEKHTAAPKAMEKTKVEVQPHPEEVVDVDPEVIKHMNRRVREEKTPPKELNKAKEYSPQKKVQNFNVPGPTMPKITTPKAAKVPDPSIKIRPAGMQKSQYAKTEDPAIRNGKAQAESRNEQRKGVINAQLKDEVIAAVSTKHGKKYDGFPATPKTDLSGVKNKPAGVPTNQPKDKL